MSDVFVSIQEKRFPARARGESRLVLKKVSFFVRAKEFVAIVGPSGCGKTTLLNIVSGLDKDFAGDVDLGQGPEGEGPRIGYVFQNPRLLPWRTVRENIALVLRDKADATMTDRLLFEVGLSDAGDVLASRLSVGMSRRAAVARAFAVRPDLLLMDEPFVSLDAKMAQRLRQLLRNLLRAHPASVLFVTHDLREAVALADRVLILSPAPGRLLGEFRVPIPPERRDDADTVEAAQRELRTYHDRLLAISGCRSPDR